MKKIIVTTDFSYVSKNALNFALEIAPILETSVNVVHVYSGSFSPNQSLVIKHGKGHHHDILDAFHAFINNEVDREGVTVRSKIKVKCNAIRGMTEWELIRLSEKSDTEMMVMGTTGSNSISGKLFGTVSTFISRKAYCPVLMVPKGATYKGFKNILFASNYESADSTTLQGLMDFATLFQACIHFVHILEAGELPEDYQKLESRIFNTMFQDKDPSSAFYMTAVNAPSIVEGLNDYAFKNNIDLTVMVSPHRNFWKNILHKSMIKTMAFNTTIPILVYHSDE